MFRFAKNEKKKKKTEEVKEYTKFLHQFLLDRYPTILKRLFLTPLARSISTNVIPFHFLIFSGL